TSPSRRLFFPLELGSIDFHRRNHHDERNWRNRPGPAKCVAHNSVGRTDCRHFRYALCVYLLRTNSRGKTSAHLSIGCGWFDRKTSRHRRWSADVYPWVGPSLCRRYLYCDSLLPGRQAPTSDPAPVCYQWFVVWSNRLFRNELRSNPTLC